MSADRPLSPALCDELRALYQAALDARMRRGWGEVSAAEVIAAESALPERLVELTDWSQEFPGRAEPGSPPA